MFFFNSTYTWANFHYRPSYIKSDWEIINLKMCLFLSVYPIWLLIFSYFSMNEPELGIGIDPGML